jgi:dCMP deaminase
VKEKHKQMYMRIAEAVALTSSAVRLKVGAVAVRDNKVLDTGYNALPSGIDGDLETKTYYIVREGSYIKTDWLKTLYPYSDSAGDYKLATKPEVRHAEANLLLNLAKGTESSNDAAIFCTHSCCKFCAMDLVDAGIKKFYYRHDYRDDEGLRYLIENGVEVEKI